MLSALASTISSPRGGSPRAMTPYGVAYHTTGSGLPARALAAGRDPFAEAIQTYLTGNGPTYVIGWKPGQIAAVTRDEAIKTAHIGVEPHELGPLQTGTWRQLVSPATVRQWERRHGKGKNPLPYASTPGLIPSTSPNDALIGVEMIPVTGDAVTFWDRPMRPGLRFTAWQHQAARALAADFARRYRWPSDWPTTRVFGHEDLNPIRRHDPGGGWDPGWLRERPYVDLDYIRGGGIPLGALAAAVAVLILVLATRR